MAGFCRIKTRRLSPQQRDKEAAREEVLRGELEGDNRLRGELSAAGREMAVP